jgi:phospho-N-acetylmuramoyl-pentapeptide-transferase
MLEHLPDAAAQLGSSGFAAFRSAMAALTAFAVVIAVGRWFVPYVASKRFHDDARKGDSEKLDEIHSHKRSTPTLGGVLIVAGVGTATLAWAKAGDRLVIILLGYTASLALLGFADDWKKLRTRRKGISAWAKHAGQIGLSAIALTLLLMEPPLVRSPDGAVLPATSLFLPIPGLSPIDIGRFYPFLALLVMTGASNAMNLTDGLDGLAAGCGALAAGTIAIAALLGQGAGLLMVPAVAGGAEAAVFLAALSGAGLGFLWFNAHPARIFMGDTGSLALGGALGLASIILKLEFVLAIAGGVLVAEAASVILQVLSFKTLGRRIFLIAPLHHHFQFKGWPETKVTVRFWIAGALCAAASLAFLAAHSVVVRS